MDEWAEIRKRVLIGGESKRAILRETGMHWQTLEKVLAHSKPPGYRRSQPRKKPKIARCPASSVTRPNGSGNDSNRRRATRAVTRR